MRPTSLTAIAVLSTALIVPAAPAVAESGQAVDHRHRGFSIGGTLEDRNLSPRRIVVDQRNGPDRTIRVRSFTRIYLEGDRVGLRALREGDRVFVQGVKKDGVRYALKIWADR